jgi:sugar phosphate isomerase/epimerase
MSPTPQLPWISRRTLLGGLAVGSLRLCCPAWATETSDIGLGFSLYGMRGLDPVVALQLCRDIGYGSVEIPVMADWPCDGLRIHDEEVARIRRALRENHLRLAGLMENLHLLADEEQHHENLRRLARAIELGRLWDPDRTPVVETILGGRPSRWPQDREAMRDRLRTWRQVAEEARGVVAIKPHVSGTVHLPEQALWLIEQVDSPAIRLAYDYSHYQLRGEKLEATLDQLLPLTAFIHVKDARGDADRVAFLLPGEGTIDYPKYFEILVERKYKGEVVVEVSGQIHAREGYDARAAAKASYGVLAAALARAESRRAQD